MRIAKPKSIEELAFRAARALLEKRFTVGEILFAIHPASSIGAP